QSPHRPAWYVRRRASPARCRRRPRVPQAQPGQVQATRPRPVLSRRQGYGQPRRPRQQPAQLARRGETNPRCTGRTRSSRHVVQLPREILVRSARALAPQGILVCPYTPPVLHASGALIDRDKDRAKWGAVEALGLVSFAGSVLDEQHFTGPSTRGSPSLAVTSACPSRN